MTLEDKVKNEKEAESHALKIELLMRQYCKGMHADHTLINAIQYHSAEYKRLTGSWYVRHHETQREE